MTVILRQASTRDEDALMGLWVEAWTALLPEIDFRARLTWFREHLSTLVNEGAELQVATSDDEAAPLGFVTVDPNTGDMDQLVVAVRAQRRGIGRALVRFAKERSPSGLSLTVVQMNRPAIRLYEREGFLVTGTGVSLRSGLPTYRMRWLDKAVA